MRLGKKFALPVRMLVVGAVAATGLVAASAAPASASTRYIHKHSNVLVSTPTRYAKVTSAFEYDSSRNRYRGVLWLDCWYKGKRTNCSVGTIGLNLYDGHFPSDGRLEYKYIYRPKGIGKDGHQRLNTPWYYSHGKSCFYDVYYFSDLKLHGKHYFNKHAKRGEWEQIYCA